MISPLKKPGKARKNKVTKEWLAFRRQWVKNHPPDYKGNYVCGICSQPVYYKEFDLDHIKNRSTHPELRLDPNNVQPAHNRCNLLKKLRG